MIHVRDITLFLPPIEQVFFFRLPSNIKKIKRAGIVIESPAKLMRVLAPRALDDIIKYSIILNDADYVVVNKNLNILGESDYSNFEPKKFNSFNIDNVLFSCNTKIKNNATHRLVMHVSEDASVIPVLRTKGFSRGTPVVIKLLIEYDA